MKLMECGTLFQPPQASLTTAATTTYLTRQCREQLNALESDIKTRFTASIANHGLNHLSSFDSHAISEAVSPWPPHPLPCRPPARPGSCPLSS